VWGREEARVERLTGRFQEIFFARHLSYSGAVDEALGLGLEPAEGGRWGELQRTGLARAWSWLGLWQREGWELMHCLGAVFVVWGVMADKSRRSGQAGVRLLAG